MRKKSLFLWLMCICFCSEINASGNAAWTRLYKKRFANKENQPKSKRKALSFCKCPVSKFSQLIFSWNARRPASGYFSFFARARNARSKKWGKWHRMVDWGKNVQRSYASPEDGKDKYVYVRLEVDPNDLADAFVVKAVANGGAKPDAIRGFSVCTSNFNEFESEKVDDHLLKLPSVHLKSVPRKSQMILKHSRAGHMCSPTSCSMLISYLIKKDISPLDFAKNCFDAGLDSYGSWPFNMAHAFELCGSNFSFSVARMNSFENLYRQLKRGIPVVVSVRGFLDGAPKIYSSGHLITIVGWDSKKGQVICHDPALDSNKKTLKKYNLKSFLSAWERSRRLTYLAEPIFKRR